TKHAIITTLNIQRRLRPPPHRMRRHRIINVCVVNQLQQILVSHHSLSVGVNGCANREPAWHAHCGYQATAQPQPSPTSTQVDQPRPAPPPRPHDSGLPSPDAHPPHAHPTIHPSPHAPPSTTATTSPLMSGHSTCTIPITPPVAHVHSSRPRK